MILSELKNLLASFVFTGAIVIWEAICVCLCMCSCFVYDICIVTMPTGMVCM